MLKYTRFQKRKNTKWDLNRFVTKLNLANNRPFNPNMVEVDYMNSKEFDHFLKPLFEAKGYKVENKQVGDNDCPHLLLTRKGKKTFVQAIYFSANVEVPTIQRAVAAMSNYDADRSFVVTNQYFTKQAKKLAKTNRIKLIDRDQLIDMVTDYKNGPTSKLNRMLAPFNLRLDRD